MPGLNWRTGIAYTRNSLEENTQKPTGAFADVVLTTKETKLGLQKHCNCLNPKATLGLEGCQEISRP